MLKGLTVLKILMLFVYLVLNNIILAQTNDSIQLSGQKIYMHGELTPETNLFGFQPTINNEPFFLSPNAPTSKLNQLNFLSGENHQFNSLFFRQNKVVNIFSDLGGYEYFKNDIIYNVSDKITLNVGFGLVKQNTILSYYKPNYQFALHSSLGYSITSWLSAYLYGQYYAPQLNKSNLFFDPFTYMNPMFFQTETGGGLRGKFKNIKADVGMKKIYDTQYQQSNPVQFMETKVTIGF